MSIAFIDDSYDRNIPSGATSSLARANAALHQHSPGEVNPKCREDVDDSDVVRSANLPALATANDVRELVQYLKRLPNGVNICDVVQPIKKRIFYPPKVEAYLSWRLVTRKGDRLKLAPLGWQFAKSLEPEAEAYRRLLGGTNLYQAALQWISEQELDLVTTGDVMEYWESTSPNIECGVEDVDLGKSVVSFFHLCQAAELGTMTIGKRGQPARLRIWRAALLDHVNRLCGNE